MGRLLQQGWQWPWHGWRFTVLVVLLLPWAALVFDALRVDPRDWIGLSIPLGGRLRLLAQSMWLALASALLSTAVGAVVAVAAWPLGRRTRTGIVWALLAFSAVPPYIHALVWSRTLDLTGWWGAMWAQSAWFGPLAIALGLAGLDSVDTLSFDAARLHHSAWKSFVRVVLPACGPFLLASVAVCFALAMLDFTVPSLFNVEVYSLDLFSELGATPHHGRVVWMSLPLLALTATACWLLWRTIRILPVGRIGSALPRRPIEGPWWFYPIRAVGSSIAVCWLVVPAFALVVLAGSPARFLASVQGGYRELGTSIAVSTMASIVSVGAAYPWSRELDRPGVRGVVAWTLVWIPLVLPPSLVAVAMVVVWNRPAFEPLTGGMGILVLAAVQRFAPVGALVLWAARRQRDRTLIEAVLVHQRSPLHGWWHVRVRWAWTGWVAAAALVLAFSVGELGASLVVAPPGHGTITMRMYNYLHAGALDSVAGTGLLMWAWTLGAGLIAGVAMRRAGSAA
jgi:iron(III) transport system permease protein